MYNAGTPSGHACGVNGRNFGSAVAALLCCASKLALHTCCLRLERERAHATCAAGKCSVTACLSTACLPKGDESVGLSAPQLVAALCCTLMLEKSKAACLQPRKLDGLLARGCGTSLLRSSKHTQVQVPPRSRCILHACSSSFFFLFRRQTLEHRSQDLLISRASAAQIGRPAPPAVPQCLSRAQRLQCRSWHAQRSARLPAAQPRLQARYAAALALCLLLGTCQGGVGWLHAWRRVDSTAVTAVPGSAC